MLSRCFSLERNNVHYLIRSNNLIVNIDHEISTSNEYSFLIIISHVSTLLNDSFCRHYSSAHEVLCGFLLAREVYIEVRIEESIRSVDRLICVFYKGKRRTIPYDNIEVFIDRSMWKL